MNNIPEELNWVKVRSECSIARAFSSLFQGIEEDIKEMNPIRKELFTGYPAPAFNIHANTTGSFFVVFQEGEVQTQIKFKRGDDRIVVQSLREEVVITLTLDDAGKCKLRLNGGEALEQWQVRRRLLEPLFFGEVMPSSPQTSADQQ